MNFGDILDTTKKVAYKVIAVADVHSPEILAGAGIVGVVAGVVLACKATLGADEVVENAKEKLDEVREEPEETRKKDLALTYAKTGFELVKLYSPAVLCETAAIVCFLASNDILKKRNAALLAAYTTIDNCFKEYRGRVIERYGEKVDHDLYYNVKTEKVEKTVTDPKTGKTKKVKETVEVADPNLGSMYARYFDAETAKEYERNSDMNLFTLSARQTMANDRLYSHGYVFLNEIYRSLGMEETKAGQIVGWTYDPDRDDKGDNYIDFRVQEVARLNDHGDVEKVLMIDPNVEGPIIDKFNIHGH